MNPVIVLIAAVVTAPAAGYFIGLTVSRDKLFAAAITDLGNWGWAIVERAQNDVTGRDRSITATTSAEAIDLDPKHWDMARIRRVPPDTEAAKRLGLVATDDEGDPPPMATVDLNLFNDIVSDHYDDFTQERLDEYHRQDKSLNRCRLSYRVLSCANCLGFHAQNLADIPSFIASGSTFGWGVTTALALPASITRHAIRRHFTVQAIA